MRHLMADYDAAVRPAQNSSLPLSVKFGVSLHHIIDVVSMSKKVCNLDSFIMKQKYCLIMPTEL